MKKKIAFIGCGNMGGALLNGLLQSSLMKPEDIVVCVRSEQRAYQIKADMGVDSTTSIYDATQYADTIVLAVKPNQCKDVIAQCHTHAKSAVVISVAAGITIQQIMDFFAHDTQKVVRAMPNTPAAVQMAMTSISANAFVSEDEKASVMDIFASFGRVMEIDEEHIHAIIACSGSSPAYVFMLLDAMIQNGMKHGLSCEQARILTSQAVLGSAKMVLDMSVDPDVLKQNVCSANGTTIEAVHALEDAEFHRVIGRAMDACYERSCAMSKD